MQLAARDRLGTRLSPSSVDERWGWPRRRGGEASTSRLGGLSRPLIANGPSDHPVDWEKFSVIQRDVANPSRSKVSCRDIGRAGSTTNTGWCIVRRRIRVLKARYYRFGAGGIPAGLGSPCFGRGSRDVFGPLTLRNRVIKAATFEARTPDAAGPET